MPRLVAALLPVLIGALEAAAQGRAPRACSAEIGMAAARSLARDCREVGPAAPALCRPETPCDALRQMIAEACRMPGGETKPACRDVDDDGDDEDDEDE